MLCVPANNEEVVNVAVPPLRVTGEPRLAPPSWNCTVPVGVAELPATLTVAVKVTACPEMEGLVEAATTVFVPAWFTACATVPLLLRKLPSPA